MFGSTILEVGISLAFLFGLFSLIASAIQEGVEGWLKVRASNLEKGIKELLGHPDLVAALYQHPLIYSLYQGDYVPGDKKLTSVLPTYIPADRFVGALLDLTVRGKVVENADSVDDAVSADEAKSAFSLDDIRTGIRNNILLTPGLRRIMLLAVDHAGGDVEKLRVYLETWFNSGMERVSGWYKRHTHSVLLFIGLIMAVSLNVDTVFIAKKLYESEYLRGAIVAQVEGAQQSGVLATLAAGDKKTGNAGAVAAEGAVSGEAAKGDANDATAQASKQAGVKDAVAMVKLAQFPIGWENGGENKVLSGCPAFLRALLGWICTAFAVSMGASFWFDTLGRLMNIRSTIKPLVKQAASADGANPAGG